MVMLELNDTNEALTCSASFVGEFKITKRRFLDEVCIHLISALLLRKEQGSVCIETGYLAKGILLFG